MEKTKPYNQKQKVSAELLNVWGKLTKRGDRKLMAAEFGCSYPTIYNAIKYGYASEEFSNKISAFLARKIKEEAIKAGTDSLSLYDKMLNLVHEAYSQLTPERFKYFYNLISKEIKK